MIRPTQPEDKPAILAIAAAIGFQPDEIETLGEMLADHFNGNSELWFTDDDQGPVGVAYCAPERMTTGTWNLLFIAIHPKRQGQDRGTALIHHVEQTLTAQDVRLLLVETSGVPDFEPTCQFYRHCGYEEEARIREFYDAGDDKIVFRKALKTVN
ncbi:GNAT family N-acetyltransferase [Acaryochloris sp. 'Moss Beach']|uniref:GNAT family N-acetyltransferase n=1 Tax=Acaryochloris sp. 'Moss Beach' TaxID=2740837 RepID=UPI001F48C7AB|nr:GNAT family N-acetyltransferase [Acaryochloris sp. 'Moss Beach']UJB68992.1 GNAT family N-acetyltransferase [Acaryochloris sp. 'Moss Beach']